MLIGDKTNTETVVDRVPEDLGITIGGYRLAGTYSYVFDQGLIKVLNSLNYHTTELKGGGRVVSFKNKIYMTNKSWDGWRLVTPEHTDNPYDFNAVQNLTYRGLGELHQLT